MINRAAFLGCYLPRLAHATIDGFVDQLTVDGVRNSEPKPLVSENGTQPLILGIEIEVEHGCVQIHTRPANCHDLTVRFGLFGFGEEVHA